MLLSFLLAALTTGCGERLSLTSVHELGTNADSNLIRVGAGEIFVVKATILRQEIEGSTAFEVDSLKSDDPRVVTVSPAPARGKFIVEATGPGETVLRASIDGDERGTVPIRVIDRAELGAPEIDATFSQPSALR